MRVRTCFIALMGLIIGSPALAQDETGETGYGDGCNKISSCGDVSRHILYPDFSMKQPQGIPF